MGKKLRLIYLVLYGFVAFVVLLLCLLVLASRDGPAPAQIVTTSNRPIPSLRKLPRPNENEAQADAEHDSRQPHGSSSNPVVVKVLPEGKTEAQARKEEYESKEKPSLDRDLTTYTFWLAIFTVALFAAACAQVGLFWWQLRLIRDSLADGKKSAEAAKASADTADRSLRELQRALILPMSFGTATIFQNGRPLGCRITCTLENSGNTVARNFTGTGNFVMWDGDLPNDFDYADRIKCAESKSVVGPKAKIPWPINVAMRDLIDIAENRRRGYFYGWVEYDDIFTSGCKRRTEFCVTLEVIGDPRIPHDKASPIECGAVGPYNAVNNDCYYKPGERPPIGGLPEPTQVPLEPPLQL